jgi:thiamine kinase-like enzyme
MPRHDPERVAALHVPGTGRVEIERLGTGLVNETFRVLRDGSAYAMRLAMSNRDDLGLDRAWEARVLEGAVAADLAPAPEYCDPSRGILISRWVDGRPWAPADTRRPSNISRMAEFMRRIHALPIPAPARCMSPAQWIDYYSVAALKSAPRDSGAAVAPGAATVPDAAGSARDAESLRAAATQRLAALAALPSVGPALCHSDLHTLNLIDHGGALVLLDWEYAHVSEALWDLAGWAANNDFEEPIRHDLLAGYLGRQPTGEESLRLQLLGWLYDYVCLWWSELYLNLRRPILRRPNLLQGGPPGVAVQGDSMVAEVSARARELAVRLDASRRDASK